MSDGYQADVTQLGAHQKELDSLATKGDQVVSAGHEVTPGGWDNAYGLLCQPFPLATHSLVTGYLDDLAKLIQAIRDTSTAIGQAAQQYQQHEEQTRQQLEQLGKPLGGGDGPGVGEPMPGRGGVRVGEPMPEPGEPTPRLGERIGEPAPRLGEPLPGPEGVPVGQPRHGVRVGEPLAPRGDQA